MCAKRSLRRRLIFVGGRLRPRLGRPDLGFLGAGGGYAEGQEPR